MRLDNGLHNLFDADTLLGADQEHVIRCPTHQINDLTLHSVHLGGWHVNLIEHRDDRQVMFQGRNKLLTVWASTPWVVSTTSSAPSHAAKLRETSYVKSTCPGVSMRLSTYSWPSPAR